MIITLIILIGVFKLLWWVLLGITYPVRLIVRAFR